MSCESGHLFANNAQADAYSNAHWTPSDSLLLSTLFLKRE